MPQGRVLLSADGQRAVGCPPQPASHDPCPSEGNHNTKSGALWTAPVPRQPPTRTVRRRHAEAKGSAKTGGAPPGSGGEVPHAVKGPGLVQDVPALRRALGVQPRGRGDVVADRAAAVDDLPDAGQHLGQGPVPGTRNKGCGRFGGGGGAARVGGGIGLHWGRGGNLHWGGGAARVGGGIGLHWGRGGGSLGPLFQTPAPLQGPRDGDGVWKRSAPDRSVQRRWSTQYKPLSSSATSRLPERSLGCNAVLPRPPLFRPPLITATRLAHTIEGAGALVWPTGTLSEPRG